MRYIEKIIDFGILYLCDGHNHGYMDVDWVACKEMQSFISGYLFILAKGAILWLSRKQFTVSRSSTELKYIALSFEA
jgi:hypothetical protein